MTLYFFYFFSFILILSSFLVIFVSNPVHSVLFLIFTFFNAAIIFLIFKAEFLAMTLLIVYVGAVAVLFLFVVMMLNISESIMKEGFLRYFPFGLLLISIFLIELFMIFNSDKIIFPETGLIKINEIMNLGMDNTKSLGLFLYTDYFIIFQISGFLLLLAMIGAIVLAHSDLKNPKSISPINQKNVDKKTIIKLN
ncbi:NADH-quinone oxidoreductase subunit J [Alphaproteobacteria bacterium]|nr:NADH-quinone oxidoreductase subunit J [Alphaproteobacteria bacterium]MDC2965904.1 NADH-quinone oxidoreductase subunit J [Alphaproteobacteria bacterium]